MKNHKIKALWLATWYPEPQRPVLGIFTQREAAAVSAADCDIVVVHAVAHCGGDYRFELKTNPLGFQELLVFYPSGKWVTGAIRQVRAYLKGIQYLLDQGFTPEIIHMHVISLAGLAALIYEKKSKTPLFLTEHWSGFSVENPELPIWKRWLGKALAARASAIFTVSKAMAVSMQRLGFKGNYRVIPNVVDTDFFKPSDEIPKAQVFRFIHVSSLDDAQKNISGLLWAVKTMAEKRQDFTLTLIGGDEGTAQAEALVSSLCLAHFVKMTGVQPQQKVVEAMRSSDAFVLFSNREGLPCVLLEAMAMGVPVISTDIPGLEDWVSAGTGLLVPRRDETALAEAMLRLMSEAGQYDKMKIREKIVQECSYPVVGGQIVAAYEAALAAAAKKRS